jgi:adenylosuccinate synthase
LILNQITRDKLYQSHKKRNTDMNTRMMKMLEGKRTVGITCLQFGDTGKGKFADLLAPWADIIVRGTGGANAGHTVYMDGEKHIFHLVPSAILHDKDGKINILGSGTAIDPRILCEELQLLEQKEKPFNNLLLSLGAKLTLPTQIVRDRVGEGSAGTGKIGTTGRGIGPTYGDHVIRIGLTINDLLNPDMLVAKVKANVAYSVRLLKSYNPDLVRAILNQPDMGNGVFYHPETMFNVNGIIEKYLEYGKELEHFITDTDRYVQGYVGMKNILLEGAQGTLLDIDYGTSPFVTSSNAAIDGLAKGAGLNRGHVDLPLGVMKGFYMTRVGEGPFPTEFGGKASAEWCRKRTRQYETEWFSGTTINDPEELNQGIALRMFGDEYGATTGRPRRTGWLDLPLLRYAMRWGGPNLVMTKLDVLDHMHEIKVCTSYIYNGPTYRFGSLAICAGYRLTEAIPSAEVLQYCEPVYVTFAGWEQSIREITCFQDLPANFINIYNFVSAECHARPKIISVGPEAEQTIFV